MLSSRYVSTFVKRRVWRYHRSHQNSYIVEKQTTQWPKEKVQKKKTTIHKTYTCTDNALQLYLPLLYWIPKWHTCLWKERFMDRSDKYFTTPLSTLWYIPYGNSNTHIQSWMLIPNTAILTAHHVKVPSHLIKLSTLKTHHEQFLL
jgi:hypothetical protein